MGTMDLEDFIDKFNVLTEKPVKYLAVQNEIKSDVKNLLKNLYDYTKSQEQSKKNLKNGALPNLLVDDFDEEQIWQQVELQNSQCWDKLVWEVANGISEKTKLSFPVKVAKFIENDNVGPDNNDTIESRDNDTIEDGGNHNIEDGDDAIEGGDNDSLIDEQHDDDSSEEMEIETEPKKKKASNNNYKSKGSLVDDDFFKLKDMEKFLLKEEKRDGKEIHNSDEESIDMFGDVDEEGSSDEEGGNDLKYNDFFDGQENSEENSEEDNLSNDKEGDKYEKSKKHDKKVRFAQEIQEESGSDRDSKTEKSNFKDNFESDEKKSEFEKRQQRLQETIARLEGKSLKEAPWQLKGEVDATKRPQNSLLEEVVDFDLTTRPPPIITEQTTVTLEDLIKRRIKDKAWDDVIKKDKPVDDQLLFRKPEILDHSKSKLSLAQVYEAEYLKQKQALNGNNEEEKEPESHTEIRDAMRTLFSKLDALCHYHYTPKPPQAEVKIVSNTPAISMEEVAPVATSDAALLAPEEVKKKQRGDLMSKEERTDTDKKRERRKKKKLQRQKGSVVKVTDHKNTKKGVESNDKSLKTSKAFFQQLNDNSNSLIKSKFKRTFKNKGQ